MTMINRFDPTLNSLFSPAGMGGLGFGGVDPNMQLIRQLKHMLHNVEHEIVQRLMTQMMGGGALGGGLPGGDPLGGGLTGGADSFGLGADPFGSLGGGFPGGGFPGAGFPGAGGDPFADLQGAIPQGFDPSAFAQNACFPQSLGGAFPNATPCGAPPPCAAQPAPLPQLQGTEKDGWLIKHGEYKKNDDGTWDITGGQYQGCKAVPTPGQAGNFTINNAQGQPIGTYQAPHNADKIASPLTFDLNGQGKVGTSDMAHGRNFRMAPDGKVTAWPAPGEAMLAFGAGDTGATLFGNNTVIDGKKFNNGFQALKALADKYLGPQRTAKGYLDKNDLMELEKKANLHMLVAGNGPGQDKNARPVEDLHIDQISLQYNEAGANADENGNQHREVGAGFVQNGQKKRVDDVWYKYQ